MYQALYRKWRPRTFDDVVGQRHITETLKNQVKSGRLSHAYLFVGTRGTGKTTCAKILAKAINCEHPENGNPCNKCASCTGIDNGTILDVEELDAASNNGVDNIRALREEAVFTPASVRKRVYIVDEVHMLSIAAFNALLKILEEPPEHLTFILATTEIHKVPATIKSRCQRFSFRRIPAEEIAGRLEYVAGQEKMDLKKDASELLSRLADGSMRDALSLLDQCAWNGPIDTHRVEEAVGLSGAGETRRLFDAVMSGSTEDAAAIFTSLYCDGKEISSILEELMELYRDILIDKVAPNGGKELKSGSFGDDVTSAYAAAVPTDSLMYGAGVLQSALAELDRSADRRFTAEMCIIRLCDPAVSGGTEALAARLSKLETALASGAALSFRSPASAPAADQPAKTASRTPAPEAPPASSPAEAPPAKPESALPEREAAQAAPSTSEAPAAETIEKAAGPEAGAARQAASPSAPGVPAALDENGWKKIVGSAVKDGGIDMAVSIFLGDKNHAEPELSGSTLNIRAKNPMAKNMIDTAGIRLAVKKAAEKILGAPVTVKVTEYGAGAGQNSGRLDALKKFGNIKFE